ncbi:MAG: hypothetical protein ACYS0C_02700 [Planctomycetota bacterium]|jgi:hypothetical protein
MKKSIIVLLLVVVLAVLVTTVFSQERHSTHQLCQYGRFMLFAGGRHEINRAGVFSGVFKIDTFTGTTWIYTTGVSKGQPYQEWQLVQ